MELENESGISPEIESAEPQAVETEPASEPSQELAAEVTHESDKPQSTEVPAYTPNFKFKVKDKELDFEDWAKNSIKDPETEKRIRELHEKAYGLDEVKNHRETIQTQYKELATKHQRLEGSVNVLGQLAKQKRYGEFFQALGIPENDVLGYAVDVLKYRELPPEQKRAIEEQRMREQQLAALEAQTQEQHTQMQTLAQQYKANEMNFVMSRPDISQVAQNYDARVGKPGAFQRAVIERGAYHEMMNQTSISAEQAVNEVIQLIGGTAAMQAPNPVQMSNTSATQGGILKQEQKPTIPAFAGQSGKSPAKKVFTRIEDIRKHAQQRAD